MVVHAMTCRPHPSVYDRPTDRYTLAALALCGGSPCGSLSPSLNRYIPPQARGGGNWKNQQNAEKNQGYAQKYTPRHQMTKNERRVGGGCNKEAGKKQRVKRQARSSSPIYQHSLRCKLMLARVLGVDMQRGSMPCAS